MKNVLLFFCLTICGLSQSQIFTINNPHFVFHKTTSQSPAHWYIEVTSNLSIDTTLRWVAHFNNIPSQWGINFDDGTTSFPMIEDLDSSDFLLKPLATTGMPLKLIIGAMLNDTPGHGSVYFDVFDPANRNDFQTIQFEFIITPGTNGLESVSNSEYYKIENKTVFLEEPGEICLYDLQGKLVKQETKSLNLTEFSGVYFLRIQSGLKNTFIRVML